MKVGDLVKWTPPFTRSSGKYNVGLIVHKVGIDIRGQKHLVVLWDGKQKGVVHTVKDLEVINESR